jgi:hypothetical protein
MNSFKYGLYVLFLCLKFNIIIIFTEFINNVGIVRISDEIFRLISIGHCTSRIVILSHELKVLVLVSNFNDSCVNILMKFIEIKGNYYAVSIFNFS